MTKTTYILDAGTILNEDSGSPDFDAVLITFKDRETAVKLLKATADVLTDGEWSSRMITVPGIVWVQGKREERYGAE